MDHKMRTCAVCRNSYKFCPRCNEDKDKELWYFSFCSSNCHDIYDVTSKYENKQINVSDAKVKLDELDLSKLDKFGASYRASIEKINSATAVKETIVEKIIETKDEEAVEIVEEPMVVETVNEEKAIRKSKKTKRNVDIE